MALVEKSGPGYELDLPEKHLKAREFIEVIATAGGVSCRFSVVVEDTIPEEDVLTHLRMPTEHIRSDTSVPRRTKREMYGLPEGDINIIPAIPITPKSAQQLEMLVTPNVGYESVSLKELQTDG